VPELPEVPATVMAVLRAGMARHPGDRIRTAGALRDLLGAVRDALGHSRGRFAHPGAPGAVDGLDEHPTARLPGEPSPEPPAGR
jgi:hypothetical protein